MTRWSLLFLVSLTAAADGGEVTVKIFDLAGASPSTVRHGSEIAARIFKRQHIKVKLIVCSPDRAEDCSSLNGNEVIVIRILRNADDYPVGPAAFGIALHPEDSRPSTVAMIFFDRLYQAAVNARRSPAYVLAYVMAHEIGHLLLGVGEHSDGGIMRAQWSGADLKQIESLPLWFTRSQAARLEAAVEQRRSDRPVIASRANSDTL